MLNKIFTVLRDKKSIILEYGFYLFVIVFILDLAPTFLLEKIVVDGTSMQDSLQNEEQVLIEKVSRYFDELPAPCSAYELIRAVYTSAKEQDENIALVLGYVKKNGEMILFCGDQRKQQVMLEPTDKLIMFSTH